MAKQVIELPYDMSFSFAAPRTRGKWNFNYFWRHGWFHCQLQLLHSDHVHASITWSVEGARVYKEKGFLLEPIEHNFTLEFHKRWHKAFIAKLKGKTVKTRKSNRRKR